MAKRRANGEGSIFKRKDGLWAAQYTDNAGKKRTLYGKTQQPVREKLKEAIKESDMGLAMDKGKITFATWMGEWLEVFAKPVCKQITYANYCSSICHHTPTRQARRYRTATSSSLQTAFSTAPLCRRSYASK